MREARAASQLNHPNICTIHEVEDNAGHPFIVMEKLEGESLKQRIRGNPIEIDQLLDIAIQVTDALAASHAKGIIHRDIKPANIFLTTNGQAKILDLAWPALARFCSGRCERQRGRGFTDRGGSDTGNGRLHVSEQARSENLMRARIFFRLALCFTKWQRERSHLLGQRHYNARSGHEQETSLPFDVESIIAD
jgi:serine/threonine protein kinase